MRQRKLPARISRRLGAALLAGVTLWTVSVTAGSTDAAGAWQALKREIPVALLRWQLGDPGQSDGLSAAAVLTLSQSPLLFSARQEIAGLRQQTEETPEETVPAPVTQPVQEEPQPAPVPAGTDNGVPAKTLVPTDPSGYTVCGRVYISNSTKYTLTGEELLKPFAAELTGDAPQILNYYAAFPGCSTQTEPSAATIAFLTDKVKSEHISTVWYIEFSNHLVADAIAEAAGAGTAMFHSCHNVSPEELAGGETYVTLMEGNLERLRERMT